MPIKEATFMLIKNKKNIYQLIKLDEIFSLKILLKRNLEKD